MRLDTSYCDPEIQGPQKGFWSLSSAFWRILYKTKVAGYPQLSGVGHFIGPQIWIRKDLGPVCFWSHGHSLSRGVYNTKVVLNVPNSAWPLGQGIGLEGPAGPWKANYWLSHYV